MKVNYLNNKDILKEIHKSKSTYCSFIRPEYSDYDMILDSVKKINKKNIAQARKNRADRLSRLAFEAAQEKSTEKLKLEQFEIKHTKVPITDIVFRIMTWEHIPVDESKSKKSFNDDNEEIVTEYDDSVPSVTKYVKVNFPPFFHYTVDENSEPCLVGKSHWAGDIQTGHFSKEHGKMTNKLAIMFMKLCERYATRSNWRGYTYNDEMKSQALLQLSQIGLQFDESKSSNPFAYYTAAITNSFTRVLNIEKRNQNLRDDILELNNLNPSYTRQNSNTGSYYEE
jgi:hypothetical protein